MTDAGSLPVLARAFHVVAAWELASRGLHMDGLADTADAFIAGGGKDRILRILDDSHTGAFGVMAMGLLLLGKFAFLSSLSFNTGRVAVLCACVVGRFGLCLFAGLFGAARDEGLLLLGKFAFLSSLSFNTGRVAVLCACVVGRFGLCLFAGLFGAARDEGLG